jgi:Domain of unknown function (DUF5753)
VNANPEQQSAWPERIFNDQLDKLQAATSWASVRVLPADLRFAAHECYPFIILDHAWVHEESATSAVIHDSPERVKQLMNVFEAMEKSAIDIRDWINARRH